MRELISTPLDAKPFYSIEPKMQLTPVATDMRLRWLEALSSAAFSKSQQ